MKSLKLSRMITMGMISGVLIAGITSRKLRCFSLRQFKSESNHDANFNISKFKPNFIQTTKQGHLNLTSNLKKTQITSFDIYAVKEFDSLAFFNEIIGAFNQSKNSIKAVIESSERSILNNAVKYKVQYFTINKSNERVKTTVYLFGDTKINTYKILIEKKDEFNDFDKNFIKNIMELINTFGLKYDKTSEILDEIRRTGINIIESDNKKCTLNKSFNKRVIQDNIETLLSLMPENEA